MAGIYDYGHLFSSFPLDMKGPKDQGRHHGTSPQPSKCLTLRSRRAFCEGKRQAPLCEGQALSQLLRALPRMSAPPPRPIQSMFGVPTHGKLFFELFLGFAPTAASRHCEEVRRSNPDIQQTPRSMSSLKRQCGDGHLWLRFIVSISFSEFYPTANDNKRLLSTTNV